MSKRRTRNYASEFSQNAVNLYFTSGRSYKQLGEELGIPHT
jgi:transposase-like protein